MLQGVDVAPEVLLSQEILGCMAVSDLHQGALRRGRAECGSSALGDVVSIREHPGLHHQGVTEEVGRVGEGPWEGWEPDILMKFPGEETRLFQPPPTPKSSWSSFRWP